MAKEFKLPDLGENIESADVLSVLVKAGDTIEKEQGIIEIETDKATIEVPSSIQGKIKDVLVKEGDKVKVGQSILVLEDSENGEQKKEKKDSEKKEESKPKKEDKAEKKEEESEGKKEPKEKKESKEKEGAVPTVKKSKGKKSLVEMKLPDLGEGIESADVLNVLIKSGDTIEKDQGVIEIETDKATIEVPSSVSGKIVEVLIKEGDKAKVGQTILKVETTEEEEAEEIEDAGEDKAEKGKKQETKEAKDTVEDEKEKDMEGKVDNLSLSETPDQQPPITKGAAPAAPSVRRIARELGVNIKDVPGSGSNGRISMDDVKAYVKKLNESRTAGTMPGIKEEKLPDFSKFGEVEQKPMSKIRAKTADHLSYAWNVIPHVTQYDKADITELEKMRKSLNPEVEKAGGKLTITSILLKISTAALKAFPQFNSSIDMAKKEIIYKKYFNIGVAVDTENGLLVPVLKNVDKKNLTELSIELNELAEKARNRKISLEEMQGACFTITNLGGIGGTYFSPIVNSPEVAILGVSRGGYEPVYDKQKGNFEPRLMLPLSLSYDHRIIDGADAARFLRWLCEVLENPIKLLME